MEDDSSSIGGHRVSTQLERFRGLSPYLPRCVPSFPSSLPPCSLRAAHRAEGGRRTGPREEEEGWEGEPDREDDEDVVKRLYAPCLGSHTSKTKRRTVKGPRGVSPSDREANWYVRLRSLACFAPSPSPPSTPSSRPCPDDWLSGPQTSL